MDDSLDETRAQRAKDTHSPQGLVQQREQLMGLHTAIAHESEELSKQQEQRGALAEAASTSMSSVVHRLQAQRYANRAGLETDEGHAKQVLDRAAAARTQAKKSLESMTKDAVKQHNDLGAEHGLAPFYPKGK